MRAYVSKGYMPLPNFLKAKVINFILITLVFYVGENVFEALSL